MLGRAPAPQWKRPARAGRGLQPGTLSDLTRINIRSLQDRVRNLLSEAARSRLEIAIYDETIWFSTTLIDGEIGILQPYLPALRGGPALPAGRVGG